MPDSIAVSEKAVLQKKMLGVKIRYVRTQAGLNQKEIGKALGISADTVSEIEYGRRDVSLPQLEVIALVSNVPVNYFWSDELIQESKLDYPTQEALALRQRIIGALLRQVRNEAGRNQEDIATILGVSIETVSNYEYGKADIPLQYLELLTEHLNVSLDYFIDQGVNPNQPEPAPASAPDTDTTTTTTIIDDAPAANNNSADYGNLSPEAQNFLANPANTLYINIAMKLSNLSAPTLRALAEGLLEVTY